MSIRYSRCKASSKYEALYREYLNSFELKIVEKVAKINKSHLQKWQKMKKFLCKSGRLVYNHFRRVSE